MFLLSRRFLGDLKRSAEENVEIIKTLKTQGFSTFLAPQPPPRRAQDRPSWPKRGPREAQEGPKRPKTAPRQKTARRQQVTATTTTKANATTTKKAKAKAKTKAKAKRGPRGAQEAKDGPKTENSSKTASDSDNDNESESDNDKESESESKNESKSEKGKRQRKRTRKRTKTRTRKRTRKRSPRAPRRAQEGPKIGPRGLQDGSKRSVLHMRTPALLRLEHSLEVFQSCGLGLVLHVPREVAETVFLLHKRMKNKRFYISRQHKPKISNNKTNMKLQIISVSL